MNVLSVIFTHDSSVSLIEDGKVIFYMKEERLSKVKREPLCFLSLIKLKEFYKKDIDTVLIHRLFNCPIDEKNVNLLNYFHQSSYFSIQKFIEKLFNPKEVLNYSSLNHHSAHAAMAFHNSGFQESLVLIADRGGSRFFIDDVDEAFEAESVFKFTKSKKFKTLHKNFVAAKSPITLERQNNILTELRNFYCDVNINLYKNGLTYFYSTAAGLINEPASECGKAMGLSSYGVENPENFFKDQEKFINFYEIENFQTLFNKNSSANTQDLPKYLIRTDKVTKENYQYYANYCKYVQNFTQEKIFQLIEKYIKETNIKNVCLSGGYANNIVANAYLKKRLPSVNFYFEPVCDDSGISIGAAYQYLNETKPECFIEPLKNNFYVHYEKEKIVDNRLVDLSYDELLYYFLNQKTIAIFDGAPEAGQRALGHRSIIFDARNKNGRDIVNVVKKREWYRPFAGVIRKEDFKDYFYDNGFEESPYMMINFDAKEHTCREFPSIIHVDNTCRIQTVTEGFFYDFITLLKVKTECPIILNTSFNLAGEPLVHSVEDAIRTFDNSKIDVLYFVEEKKALLK